MLKYMSLYSSYFPHEFIYSASMEVSYSSVIAAMDNLWFHRMILLAEPVSVIYSKPAVKSCFKTEVEVSDDRSGEDDVSSDSLTSSATSQDDHTTKLEEKKPVEYTDTKSPPNQNPMKNKESQSKPSYPLSQRRRKSLSYPLDKGKILRDLELIELKGFLDLGFDFQKDRLSPRTMNVIPGLQTLGEQIHDGKADEIERDNRVIAKPYLSDAWVVKKPDSPLLRLRMARVSKNAEDMKKCLKLWATTVASSIQYVQ